MSKSKPDNPNVLVLYHYFYPDDVVSSRHLTDLAVGLAERGHSVEAMPSNRACRNSVSYPSSECYKNVLISRIYRPDLDQSKTYGRIINLLWMIVAWSLLPLRRKPDVLIVGTDPILSILVALPWKILRPRTKIVHWCFDLYPDAAVASRLLRSESWITKSINRICHSAYKKCRAIVDIGQCMRARLPDSVTERCSTIVPWALSEPDAPLATDLNEREAVFGKTKLAIMYSGNFGEAHSYEGILELARRWSQYEVTVAFSVRGNKVDELKSAVTGQDTNIRFVPFADEDKINERLSCPDIHLVTLAEGWEGIVVPSKFFGALAIGRPVLFDGPRESAIAGWINEHQVGWLLRDVLDQPFEDLKLPTPEHCHAVYQKHFSMTSQIDSWHELLKDF